MSEREDKNVIIDDVQSYLMSAVKEGDLECVETLISSHGLANCKDLHGGYWLLCNAIKLGHIDIAQFLLEKGAKVNCKTHIGSPLHFAVDLKPANLDLISLLLEKNAWIDELNGQKNTPLHIAAKNGYADIVQILLDNKASVMVQNNKGSTPLLLAGECKRDKVIKTLFNHIRTNVKYIENSLPSVLPIEKRDSCLLHAAVELGYKEFIKLLLALGFNVNAKNDRGKPPLFYSLFCNVEDDCVDILQLLFVGGANIKETPELLHDAVCLVFIDVCKVLIENGADVNALSVDGRVPLHLAFPNENEEESIKDAIRDRIIKLLLDNNADVRIKTREGFTAFHLAVIFGRQEIVSTFLSHGVNVNMRDEDNATPLHYAALFGSTEIARILCGNGADVDSRQIDEITPLHLAANRENAIVEILLDSGCDINAEEKEGITALDMAISRAECDYHDNHQQLGRESNDDDGDNDDDDDDSVDLEGYENVTILKQHITKLEAAGLFVSKRNLNLAETMDFEDSFSKQECEAEIDQMKNTWMKNEELDLRCTLYDFLVKGRNFTHVKTKSLMQILGSPTFKKFPIYKGLLSNIFENNKMKLELVDLGLKSLKLLIKTNFKFDNGECLIFPDEVLEKIVTFLNTSELRSLVFCGTALKQHLSR